MTTVGTLHTLGVNTVQRHCARSIVWCMVLVHNVLAEPPRVLHAGNCRRTKACKPWLTLTDCFLSRRQSIARHGKDVRPKCDVKSSLPRAFGQCPLKHRLTQSSLARSIVMITRLKRFPSRIIPASLSPAIFLYRPKNRSGKLPAVLCPHGHWPEGRFHDAGPTEIRKQLVEGTERFELSGRYPLQARCVQLARMGCVVLHYDMVGYGDSKQLAHRDGIRPEMNCSEKWGFLVHMPRLDCNRSSAYRRMTRFERWISYAVCPTSTQRGSA